MNSDLKLRRKWTYRAHGRQMVFIKKPYESDMHVSMKAFLWALFLPDYPNLSVEMPAGERYKPDLVQFDDNGKPVFWAEAGQVSGRKIQTLVQRHRSAHLVFAKWNQNLEPLYRIIKKEVSDIQRPAPVDLISFPGDSENRFISAGGRIDVRMSDVTHRRFPAAEVISRQT